MSLSARDYLILSSVLLCVRCSSFVNLKVEGYSGTHKQRICDKGLQHYQELNNAVQHSLQQNTSSKCSYVEYTCYNIGQRSELSVGCTDDNSTSDLRTFLEDSSISFNVTVNDTVQIQYTATLSIGNERVCDGVLEWNNIEGYCGCKLGDYSSLNMEYENMTVNDYIRPEQDIKVACTADTIFSDYDENKVIICGVDTDLASYNCQTEEELKEFDNKVAHFDGTLASYVIVDAPFSQELTELALCLWLRTKDAVGSILSLANEDHWNALRFDTHTSHLHFTMAGLHTDHGLVPKIALKDDDWRFFCANWNSSDGKATIFVRKHGEPEETVVSISEILHLSINKTVKATGGKLALGNLWKEDVVDMSFNSIGSFEGDVMGLTLFNTTVNLTTFNAMFDGCSTILDKSNVVLSWKSLLSSHNDVKVSATFGQQVCSKGNVYGESAVNFPYSHNDFNLSNYVQNYAKIENAFSIDLTEFTICVIIKSKIQIGTIFSYVTTVDGFKDEIVLEKHKTHMHFYMAGIDQQVGAVPSITIDTKRWYTPCFTWDNTGRWRGYLDGTEVTNNQTALLEYTKDQKIRGGGTCYLGILKTFNSFREYRGYGGDITELNLWGKALSAEQIKHMVKSNQIYEEDLLVSWGTLLENRRGSMTSETNQLCLAPDEAIGDGTFQKTNGSINSTLYEIGDVVTYNCLNATSMSVDSTAVKTCSSDKTWQPTGEVLCQMCEEADMFECPNEMCIEHGKVCDGNKDCSDGSDELDCSKKGVLWLVIGVLLALIFMVIPTVFLLKRAKTVRAEIARVKRLTDDWEVRREHLQLEEKLGEGAFGKVFKGLLLTKPNYDTPTTVAVKELSDIATERDRNMFLEEIRLSKKLGNHPNIVGIVGSIIVYQPYNLILEFVDGGDILQYLQNSKEDASCDVTQEDQVFFAWQIANGMEYVSKKNFVHRDLAARNILISTKKQCKVTDFGLARDLYNYDEYQSEGGRLPIKWMSPEAIFELKFTTESDVWSYAVLLYELFSWGGSPYPGIDPALLRDRLVNGFRMSAPDNTPDFIYSVMLQCWEFKSADRPSFTNIRTFIEERIKHYKLFQEFQAGTEYINMTETAVACELEAVVPEEAANEEAEIATEYKNVTFTGPSVSFTTEPTSSDPLAVAYRVLKSPEQNEENEIRPVNVGFVDSNGIAELTRSDYMNT